MFVWLLRPNMYTVLTKPECRAPELCYLPILIVFPLWVPSIPFQSVPVKVSKKKSPLEQSKTSYIGNK